jgi:hypothetical protein
MNLGSEERQTLIDEDIPQLVDLPSGNAEVGAVSGAAASGSKWQLIKYGQGET